MAYDVASVLCGGGQLPESTYQAALGAFGETATAHVSFSLTRPGRRPWMVYEPAELTQTVTGHVAAAAGRGGPG